MKKFVENMLTYERDLFFMLNGSNSVLLDNIMHTVSVTKVWIPLYAFVLFLTFYKTPIKQSVFIVVFFILLITLCDQFSSGLIKPIFERLRPGHHPDFKDLVQLVNNHRGGGYAFISGHATNSVGFAVFLSLLFRQRWVTLVALVWAGLISYSRIYLGMHFVSDVVGGIVAGALIAIGLYAVLIPLRKKLFKLDDSEKTQIYSAQRGRWMWIGFTAYFLAVVIWATIIS
jgi:undecaprenyl-diphosphatase